MAARVGLAPTPCGLTNRRATFTPPGNGPPSCSSRAKTGAADRILTCIVPFRRRMPDVFDHGSNLKWSERQDWTSQVLQSVSPDETFASRKANHLRPRGPKPRALKTELRSILADPKGVAPSRESHPQPSRRQRGALLIELRIHEMACRAKAQTSMRDVRLRPLRFDATTFARHCVTIEGWWEMLVTLQSSSSSTV
jgi:hypothetical protein